MNVPCTQDADALLISDDLQMQALQDGTFRTWAIDTASKQVMGAGSGDVSTQNLVCNEIGREAASGGIPPLSGDTTRGETIRNFDLIQRRFGDQPVVERVVFVINPTDTPGANPGKYNERAGYAGAFFGWAEEDILHIDLADLNITTLADFFLPSATAANLYSGTVPAGTIIFPISPYDDIVTTDGYADAKIVKSRTVGSYRPASAKC